MMVTKRLLYLLSILLVFSFSYTSISAQNCTPIFHKLYYGSGNDESYDIAVTSDKGSIVTGRTSSNSSKYDGFLMKLDEQGNIQWANTYGGSEYDELVKVKQTSDGGYVALGTTKSFGAANGEAWLIKTDAAGAVLWLRLFNEGSNQIKAKTILQLNDGGYLLAVNTNDSTVQGDGIIIRTDAMGNIIWTELLDNGGDDGVNSLYADGNTFLLGGYATVTNRQGILMRLNVSDGSLVWSKRFARQAGTSDEVVDVEKIQGGLAFGISSTWPKPGPGSFNPYFLTLFKTRGDSNIFFQRRLDISTGSGYKMERVNLRTTFDSGFIYLINDTTVYGAAAYRKIAATGLSDWGHQSNNTWENCWLKGVDIFDNRGYIVTGYLNSIFTNQKNRIQVLKTDIMGITGSCDPLFSDTFTDTTFYDITPFQWKKVSFNGVSQNDGLVRTQSLTLTISTLCSDKDCDDPDKPASSSCYSSFITRLKEKYGFMPYDVVHVNDGYILMGYNNYFRSVEPMIMKLRSDGTVIWSKTLTRYMHNQEFNKVLVADDGNLIIMGKDEVTVDHGGFNGSIILKVTASSGDIIWAKAVNGEVFELAPADNGGFIGSHISGYGAHPIYISLFKLDRDGNMIWKRQTNKGYDAELMYTSIVYDGSYIYAAGRYGSGSRIAIEKIDTAGKSIWLKSFMINGYGSTVESLHLIGDSLYLMAGFFDGSVNPYFPPKKIATVKMAKDGSGMNGFALDNLGLLTDDHYYYFYGAWLHVVNKTIDNNFVVAELTRQGSDSALVITKFSPITGQILWSRKYDSLKHEFVSMVKDDNGGLMVLARKFLHDNYVTNIYEGLFFRTDASGVITQNGVGECHNVSNSVNIRPISFSEVNLAPTQRQSSFAAVESYEAITRTLTTNAQLGCFVIGNCSTIQLTGPTIVCNAIDTITFKAKRNEDCTSSPLWSYDNAVMRVVGQTDSSFSVVFKKAGKTKIAVYLPSSCGIVKDSITVALPALSSPLDLGNDTTICSGNSLVINAHKGFASYKWQDGSTDSSFTVTHQGKYFVTVMDSCGGTSSDTIVVAPHSRIPFYAGANRIKCNSDTLHINAPSGFINYTWSPSYNISSTTAQSIIVNPTKDTSYFVKAEQAPGCFAYDTVRVKVNHSPSIFLGNDTSFCYGESVLLDAGRAFSNYLWNDGSSLQKLSVGKAGIYSVMGTTVDGCNSYDTLKVISVWPLPTISLDHNSELCQSSTRILDPGVFSSYLWQDGSTLRKYNVRTTGSYYVQVTDNNGCVNADTVQITTIISSPTNFLPNDTSICSYSTADLKPVRSFASYTWNNGSTMPKITVDKAGRYWLQVRDSKGCIGEDTIVVSIRDCMVGLRVPTAFTPNHDATNNVFRALLFGNVKSFELTIYNRWGQVVFYTTDRYKGWDGTVAGREQDSGVFIWLCKYQLEGDQQKVERGTVTLMR